MMLDGSGKPIVPPSAKVPDPSAMGRSGSIIPAFRPVGVIETPAAPTGPSPVTMSSSSYPGMASKMAGRVPPAGGGFWNPAYNVPPPVSAPIAEAPAASGAMRDLRAIGAPISKVASGLGSFGSFLVNNPVVNNPLTRTAARVAAPVGVVASGASALTDKSGYKDPLETVLGIDNLNQRVTAGNEAFAKGDYKTGLLKAAEAVPHAAYAATLRPLVELGGFAANKFADYLSGPAKPPITMDKDGNFSRAPTNAAEYKQMMDLKPKATMATAADIGVSPSSAPSAKVARPAMSYDEWVMKQPTSKLDADGYARRAQLEIEKRRPETTQQNIMMATNYAMSHPDMVTSETRHRDGSWSKTYGDRAANAIQGYGSFRNALAREEVEGIKAQAALERAQNSEKFTAADKVGLVGQVQNQMMQTLLGDSSIPAAQRIRAARAYWPTFLSALKQNGVDPSTMDFDSFIQEQTGAIADPAYPGTYRVPK